MSERNSQVKLSGLTPRWGLWSATRSILIIAAMAVMIGPLFGQETESTEKTETETEESSVVRVSATGELRKIEGSGEYAISFDFGDLPTGKTAVMRLKISNPLDEDVSYNGVSKRCACSQFAPRKSTIPKNETRDAVIRMKTPASSQTPRVSIPVILLQKEKPAIRMSLDFGLEGLLSFSELVSVLRFENSDTTRIQEMPFLMTPPLALDDLRVEHSENLNGIEFEILPGPEGGVLRATVPEAVLADGDVRGEVFLVNANGDQRRTLYFSIKDGRRSEISPRVIQFRRVDGGWRAMAVVRMGRKFSSDAITNTSEDAKEKQQPVRCQWQGKPVEVKLSQISDSMYRVELFVANNRAADLVKGQRDSDSSVLDWTISDGNSELKLRTPFVTGAVDDG